ncbi:MAG: zf-HC2 domain-containing protein [Chloroflexota bacterium]
MMKHISERSLAYLEKRLTLEARAQVEAHLRECASCQAEVESLRQTHAVLTNAGHVLARLPARHMAWAGVRQRVYGNSGRKIFPAVRRSWQVAASVAVVAMALASNFTLNAVRAATPSVPAIQTPAAHISIVDDTATMQATRATLSQDSTFMPTLTPGPEATN